MTVASNVWLDGGESGCSQDPAGRLKSVRDKPTERIDGIVALIITIGRAVLAREQVTDGRLDLTC